MTTGLLLAFASAVLFAANNLLGKFVSSGFSIRASMVVQYAFMAVFGAVAVALFGTFRASLDGLGWAVLAGCGIVGYLGFAVFLLALRRAPIGVVISVSYAYVFVAYLANAWLFPEVEKLSVLRLALGAAFFAVIAFFLVERRADGKVRIGASAALPLVTALCWGAYMAAMNWLLKTGRLTDVQVTFYSEGAIFLVAAAAWAATLAWRQAPRAAGKMGTRAKLAYLGWGLAMYGGVLTANMAFSRAPANLVNFVALSSVVIAPALGYVFFREKMTRAQVATGAVAALLLGAFVLAG